MATHQGSREPKIAVDVSSHKQPSSSIRIEVERRPIEGVRVDYYHLKACWRIKRLQLVDPYSFHHLTADELANLQARLSSFESMTWNEIFLLGKKQNHSIAVPELRCPHAKKWMRDNMPDQPELWTIRISGAGRIWGVFSEGAYQAIFWDPHHLIFPTNR